MNHLLCVLFFYSVQDVQHLWRHFICFVINSDSGLIKPNKVVNQLKSILKSIRKLSTFIKGSATYVGLKNI